jgi:hypothetical protein
MALLWVDGFEGYGTSIGAAPSPTGVIARRYIDVITESILDVENGRISGRCLELLGNTTGFSTPALTTNDTLIVGLAFKLNSAVVTNKLVHLYDGVTKGVNLHSVNGGELELYRGATLLDTTSGLGLTGNTWYWLEMKIKCHDTSGEYEVRIAENNVMSGNSVDTKAGTNNYHDRVYIRVDYGSTFHVDDFYVCDITGSYNNDFLGNCRVTAIFPDGDDTTGWTTVQPGPNHWEAVDETVVDDDTTYVQESTVNNKDYYDYANASGIGEIKGIQINTDCRETDATTFDLITPIKSGATEDDDTAQTIGSTDYITLRRVSEEDPNTSNTWTTANLNAAKFGVKVG